MPLPQQLLKQYYGNTTLAMQWLEHNGLAHWEVMQRSRQQRLVEPRELPILCLSALKVIVKNNLKPLLIPQGGEILYNPLCDLIDLFELGELLHPILLHIKPTRGSSTQVGATYTRLDRLILAHLSPVERESRLHPDQIQEIGEWWKTCTGQQQLLLHTQVGMPLETSTMYSWLQSSRLSTLVQSIADVGLDASIRRRWTQNSLFQEIVTALRHTGKCNTSLIRNLLEQSALNIAPYDRHLLNTIMQKNEVYTDLPTLERLFRQMLRIQIHHLNSHAIEFWTCHPLNIALRKTRLARAIFVHPAFILLDDSTVTGESWLCSQLLVLAFNSMCTLVFMPFRDRECAKGNDTQSIANIHWQNDLALEEDYQA